MSTTVVHLVPADPWFVPTPEQEDAARHLYAHLMPGGEDVESTVDGPMGFVHLVENAGEFWCPRCGAEIGWPWLFDRCDDVHPGPITLACCGGRAELGELRSTTGDCFARFTPGSATPTAGTSPRR